MWPTHNRSTEWISNMLSYRYYFRFKINFTLYVLKHIQSGYLFWDGGNNMQLIVRIHFLLWSY